MCTLPTDGTGTHIATTVDHGDTCTMGRLKEEIRSTRDKSRNRHIRQLRVFGKQHLALQRRQARALEQELKRSKVG